MGYRLADLLTVVPQCFASRPRFPNILGISLPDKYMNIWGRTGFKTCPKEHWFPPSANPDTSNLDFVVIRDTRAYTLTAAGSS
jgi:hypothetical protein